MRVLLIVLSIIFLSSTADAAQLSGNLRGLEPFLGSWKHTNKNAYQNWRASSDGTVVYIAIDNKQDGTKLTGTIESKGRSLVYRGRGNGMYVEGTVTVLGSGKLKQQFKVFAANSGKLLGEVNTGITLTSRGMEYWNQNKPNGGNWSSRETAYYVKR